MKKIFIIILVALFLTSCESGKWVRVGNCYWKTSKANYKNVRFH